LIQLKTVDSVFTGSVATGCLFTIFLELTESEDGLETKSITIFL